MYPPRLSPLARAVGSAVFLLSLAQAPALAAELPTAPPAAQTAFNVPPGELSAAIASLAIEA